MLAHMTEMTDKIEFTDDTIKTTKPNTFHEAFFKTGIDPEGSTRLTSKANQPVITVIAKAIHQQ